MPAEDWRRTCPSAVSAWDRQRMRGWGSSMSFQLLRPMATAQQPLLHVSIGPFAPGRLQPADPESPKLRARRAVHPGCSRQQGSSVDRLQNVVTCSVLAGVIQEALAGQPYRFRVVGQFPVWRLCVHLESGSVFRARLCKHHPSSNEQLGSVRCGIHRPAGIGGQGSPVSNAGWRGSPVGLPYSSRHSSICARSVKADSFRRSSFDAISSSFALIAFELRGARVYVPSLSPWGRFSTKAAST